uniref:G-protein coupled receptors family 1 profile domain-containing protein n=1 Tax=Oreochromis aureus TaxID=47969 RepID=A0AAZ1XAZ6_OREAU
MERFDVIHVIFLINIYVCLPLTMAVSCWVCFVVRKEQAPITYYTNLLFSNLVQCSMMIPFIVQGNSELHGVFQYSPLIFCCAVIASVNFKMCIATERCLVITRPQWNCIRQTKGSVLLSVLVWTLSVITVPLAVFFYVIILPVLIFFALVPSFLFILTLVWTLKALPAATSVPTEEKRRIVGTLVLLLLNYCVMF